MVRIGPWRVLVGCQYRLVIGEDREIEPLGELKAKAQSRFNRSSLGFKAALILIMLE